MRSSGSFSMRMMMPTVPIAWMSSGVGFSTSSAFCVAKKIMRLPANAASIALIDMSRPTNSGSTIYGKTTMSRTGKQRKLVGNFHVLRGCQVLFDRFGSSGVSFVIVRS